MNLSKFSENLQERRRCEVRSDKSHVCGLTRKFLYSLFKRRDGNRKMTKDRVSVILDFKDVMEDSGMYRLRENGENE